MFLEPGGRKARQIETRLLDKEPDESSARCAPGY